MKSFAVIGIGLFGKKLATDLFDAGQTVLAIDSKEAHIEEIADNVTRAAILDATNREALAQLGINKYDCVIVATSHDLATSVIITMNLKALNVPKIVCKVMSDTDREILETLGANMCITPEHIAASKLARRLMAQNIIDYTQISKEHSLVEIETPSVWAGKSILDINVRAKYGINIIAIIRGEKTLVYFPPSEVLQPTDLLLIIGNDKDLERVQKL